MAQDAESDTLFNYATKRPNTIEKVSIKLQAQYPSEWFAQHPDKKPLIIIPNSNKADKDLAEIVYKDLTSSKFNMDHINEFIASQLKAMEGTLLDDWITFGAQIGKKGDKITPENLFERETKDAPDIRAAVQPLPEGLTHRGLLIFCLLPYRLVKLREDYQTSLWNRLKTMITHLPSALSTIASIMHKERCFQQNGTYCALVAAIDMFLNQFPDCEYSEVRIATISSRFRDCAALLSVNHFIDFTGISKYSEVMDWIFTHHCAQDMDRLTVREQEVMNPLSYFPYQVDFRLVRKSNYSAVINQSLFFWIQAVCALLGSQRSMNARMNLESNVPAIITNALVTAYVLKSRISLTKAYGGNADDEAEFIKAVQTGEARMIATEHDMPSSNRGGDWFVYLAERKFIVPEPIISFGKERAEALSESREQTVGYYLHKYFQ